MPLKPFIPLVEPLRFPSPDGSKFYEVAPAGMDAGARLALGLDPKSPVEVTPLEEQQILLGPTREEMIADDVSPEYFARVFLTAYTDWARGRAKAELAWETGGDPKVLAALTGISPESPLSTRSGGATETPSPVSSSTTTSSPKSSKRSPKAATSPGTSSSNGSGASSPVRSRKSSTSI